VDIFFSWDLSYKYVIIIIIGCGIVRLYIQEKENLIKFNLPAKVDGSMLFSYKSYETDLENSLNIDSDNSNWVLKSNGNVNILNGNSILENIILTNYMCVLLSVMGKTGYLCMYSN